METFRISTLSTNTRKITNSQLCEYTYVRQCYLENTNIDDNERERDKEREIRCKKSGNGHEVALSDFRLDIII
jgi:hypothetical protein